MSKYSDLKIRGLMKTAAPGAAPSPVPTDNAAFSQWLGANRSQLTSGQAAPKFGPAAPAAPVTPGNMGATLRAGAGSVAPAAPGRSMTFNIGGQNRTFGVGQYDAAQPPAPAMGG